LELRHLRYFIRAAEMLHFTRAAESLYISQPSLSIHIQQLEEELKTKLFARVGRSVLLTESGQTLLVRARRAVQELEAAEREIDAMTDLLRGSLTIGTISLFGSKVLPPCIDAFVSLYPQVHISVRSTKAEDIEAGLVAGTYDIGFSLLPTERAELQTREIMVDQICMLVANSHTLANKAQLVPDDLNQVLMALPSHKYSTLRPIGAYFEAIGVHPNVVVEQEDGNALLGLVKLGGFATFLPELLTQEDETLVKKHIPDPGVPLHVAAMWTQLSPAAKAFLDIVDSPTGVQRFQPVDKAKKTSRSVKKNSPETPIR